MPVGEMGMFSNMGPSIWKAFKPSNNVLIGAL